MKQGFDTCRVADNIDNNYSQARGKSVVASRRKIRQRRYKENFWCGDKNGDRGRGLWVRTMI